MHEGDSLWLELADPVGYLPLLPWEEMLRPVTSAPILRLSPHVLQALSPDRELSVVLCLTVPSPEWAVTAVELMVFASTIRESIPERSTLHVFADDLCHAPFVEAMKQVKSDDPKGRTIKVYDLPRKMLGRENAEDPWKVWIAESLAGRATDIVHFVALGMLFADHSRLVIAAEPSAKENPIEGTITKGGRLLRYVTPIELCDSFTALGAWAAVFSAPTGGRWLNQARTGLRLLVDQIGRLRPGMAVFHDMEADADCKALAETYKFMIGDPSIPASLNTSVSVYCHPARAATVHPEPQSVPGELMQLMQQYAKVKELIQAEILRKGPLPTWIAATQRIVEEAVSRATAREGTAAGAPVLLGLASALEYVEKMLVQEMTIDEPDGNISTHKQQDGGANG
jgi:hypothetical protein